MVSGPEAKLSSGPSCYVKSNTKVLPGHIPQHRNAVVRPYPWLLKAGALAFLALLTLISLIFPLRAHSQASLLLALVTVPRSPQFSTGR